MPRMPQVTAQELVRFLKSQAFIEDRQSGSHLTLWHQGRKVSVTIPIHTGCDLSRGLTFVSSKTPASPLRTSCASARIGGIEVIA